MISKIKIYNERGKLIEIVNVFNPYAEPKSRYRLKNKNFNLNDKDRELISKVLDKVNIHSNIGGYIES